MYFRIEYQWFHLLYLNNKNLTPTLQVITSHFQAYKNSNLFFDHLCHP